MLTLSFFPMKERINADNYRAFMFLYKGIYIQSPLQDRFLASKSTKFKSR